MNPQDLRGRLATTLDPDPVPEPGPRDLLAAVLIPIVEGAEPSVVFTRRTDHLSRHAGEISFPGGLRHAEDATLQDTAVRETQEELGLAPASVDVLGALPAVHTFVSGILVVPFVGMLSARLAFTPNADEIAEVLEYSLARLAEAESEVELPGGDHVYQGYAYEMEDHTIWGATARMLHSLFEALPKELA